MEIDHLSASSVNIYLRCPAQYFWRYCEGLIVPPSGAMTRGNAFHTGTYKNYDQKVASHEDLPVDDVLDIFSTEYDIRAHDTLWQDGEDKGEVKDSGVAVLREYQTVVAPTIQPVCAEREFALELENKSWKFTGIIDVVTDGGVVVENKTTGKGLKTPRHDHLIQTTGYSIGSRSESGVAAQAELIYAVAKKKPEVLRFPVDINTAMILYFLNLIAVVANGIEKEVWLPNRGHFLCSRKWCGYADRCVAKYGGTVD